MNNPCPFCHPDREIIAENELAFAIYDKFPVNPGHCLIVPKRHVADYFDLQPEEQTKCIELLNHVKGIIEKNNQPDGYNIGINVNEAAGQTVFHVHIHLITRYKGDVENPRGGVRGVVPGKREY